MRFINLSAFALFPLFVGCGIDYNVDRIGHEPNPGSSEDDVDEDDGDIDEEEPEDTGYLPEDTGTYEEPIDEDDDPIDPNECAGFLINEGYGNYEETETFAIFSLVGDSEIEVRQGETATLKFGVTAYNCGDIVFNGLTVVQSVIDYTPAQWVTDVESSEPQSEMSHLSGSASFGMSDGYNCNSDGYDSQLFYWWRHDNYNANIQSEMDEVYINAATTEVFEFNFKATEYIPVGTTFDLYLLDPEWIDVGTGAEVRDFYYYSPSFDENVVRVRVTII